MLTTFYSIDDDKRKIQKNLDSGVDIECKLYNDCDVLHPVLITNYQQNLLLKNYVYIPEFGRYYFINNITVETGGKLLFSLDVDVLTSFQDELLNIPVIITRNENISTPDFVDSNIPVKVGYMVEQRYFSGDLGNYGEKNVVLEILGGGYNA